MRRHLNRIRRALAARRGRARRLRDLRPLHSQAVGHDLGEHPRHDCHQRGSGTRAGWHDPGGRACRAIPRGRRCCSADAAGGAGALRPALRQLDRGPRRRDPARAGLTVHGAGARAGLAGRCQLHARRDTRPKQRREQRPPGRHHVERNDARAMGPSDLRAGQRHRRLRGPPADAARHLRASQTDLLGLGRKRMGTAELTCRSTHAPVQKMDARLRCPAATHPLRLALVYAVLWTITLLGALLGTACPGSSTRRPTAPRPAGELGRARVDRGRQRPGPVRAVPARLLPLPGSPSDPSVRRSADRRRARRERATCGARARPLAHPTHPVRAAAAARMAGRRSRRSGLARPEDGRSTADRDRLPRSRPLGRHSGRGGRDDRSPPRAHPHAQCRAGFDDRGTSFSGPHPCAEGRGWIAFARIVRRRRQSLQGRFAPFPRCRSVPLGRLAGAAGLRQPPPDPAKEGPP